MSLVLSMLGSDQNLDPGSTPTFVGVKNTANIGTANTGTTAVEYGDGYHHQTILTVNTTLPSIAGGAALGVGKLIYTFPAGAVVVHASYKSIAITQTQGHINANTPDVALGTTIASGVISTLTTSSFKNLSAATLSADCTGTANVDTVGEDVAIEVGDNHTVYINVAATWAASGDTAALLTGTVVIEWVFMN